jgi:hypothetical protein
MAAEPIRKSRLNGSSARLGRPRLRWKFDDAGISPPIFQVLDLQGANVPSIDNLEQTITLNSTSISPDFLYTADNATISSWTATVGTNLSIIGSGTYPGIDAGSPLFGSGDTSIQFQGTPGNTTGTRNGKVYAAPNTSSGDITTEDYILEGVFEYQAPDPGATSSPLAKWRFTGGSFVGWQIDTFNSGGGLFLRAYHNWNTADYALVQTSDGIANGNWYHVLVAANRDGLGYLYVNGVLAASASYVSSDGLSATSNVALTIGSISDGQANTQHSEYGGKVAYAAMWKQSDWLSASPQAELDLVVSERFAKMSGIYPQLSTGAELPITSTRSTAETINAWDTFGEDEDTYTVGPNWMEIWRTRDGKTDRDLDVVKSNSFPNSEDFDGAEWNTFQLTIDSNPTVISASADNLQFQSLDFDIGSPTLTASFAIGEATPTTASALTNATYEREVAGAVTVNSTAPSNGYIRAETKRDGSDVLFTGLLIEEERTNLINYSNEMNNWVKVSAGISSNVATSPGLAVDADGIVANSSESTHYIRNDITVQSNVTNTTSGYFKKGSLDWIYLAARGGTRGLYFNIANGTVGFIENAIDYGIEDVGNGWYYCWFSWQDNNTSSNVRVYPSEGDQDQIFSGDDSTVQTYVWGMQTEISSTPSSLIPTFGTTATRSKDRLTYAGGDKNINNADRTGAVMCDVLIKNKGSNPSYLFTLLNNTTSTDFISVYADATTGVPIVETSAAAGNPGVVTGSTDICDGTIHSITLVYQNNSLLLYVDGAQEGTEDTSVTIPDNLNEISLGSDKDGNNQLNGDVSDFKIYRTGVVDVVYRNIQADALVGSAVNNRHGIFTDLTPSDDWQHLFVAYVKPGNRSAVRIQSQNQAAANVWAQFKLDGTETQASLTSGNLTGIATVEAVEDGFYKCTVPYNGGTANHRHTIQAIDDAEVDDVTYLGDGSTPDIYIAIMQHDYSESSTGRTVSDTYVRTEGGGRTVGEIARGYYSSSPSTLDYNGTLNVPAGGRGAVACDVLIEPSSTGSSDLYVWAIHDDKTASDHIMLRADATTGLPILDINATAGTPGAITGSTNICDGINHSLTVNYVKNNVQMKVDGVVEGTITSVTIPDHLNHITLGTDKSGNNHLEGLLWNFKVYNKNNL